MDDLSRRRMLSLGTAAAVVGGATLLSGGSALAAPHLSDSSDQVDAASRCVPESTLVSRSDIGGSKLIYDSGSGTPAGGKFNSAFHQKLVAWRNYYNDNNPWVPMTQIWHLGVLRPGDADSWHCAGRAIDLTRGIGTDASAQLQFSFRYDQWKDNTGPSRIVYERRYWAAVASLHAVFRDVLTYRFNTAHYNHVHVDNGQSGTGPSTFSTGSGTQVESVQAMLHFIWGYSNRQTSWSESVDGARCAAVLQRIGVGGRLTTSTSHWRAFLRATCRKGTGLQAY